MIVIAGLIVAFVLLLLFCDPRTRHCRWRARRQAHAGKISDYKCMTCGAETTTRDGRPPRHCLRDRPPPGL